jgi:hypothetical protein
MGLVFLVALEMLAQLLGRPLEVLGKFCSIRINKLQGDRLSARGDRGWIFWVEAI